MSCVPQRFAPLRFASMRFASVRFLNSTRLSDNVRQIECWFSQISMSTSEGGWLFANPISRLGFFGVGYAFF
jgi:hypothetical protein